MQRSRYPDKWTKNKYEARDLPPAPYTAEPAVTAASSAESLTSADAPSTSAGPMTPAMTASLAESLTSADAPSSSTTAAVTALSSADAPSVSAGPMTPAVAASLAESLTSADAPSSSTTAAVTALTSADVPSGSAAAAGTASEPPPLATARAHQGQVASRQAQPAETATVCGKNAVLAALRSGQSINRVLLAEGLTGAFATEVIKRCREHGVPYQFVPKARLTMIAGPDHRGVACELSAFNYAEVEDMLENARQRGEQPLLLLLDGVEDPHNLGAVIRTALCAGAHGVIIPKRRSAALNATVASTSAGASAYLPVARVANLSQTARALKEAGLWLAAADMDGQTAWKAPLSGPLALVLGGEDQGVSPLLKQGCDFCVSLPMAGNLGSLNVSAAAAALLYEIRRQREG